MKGAVALAVFLGGLTTSHDVQLGLAADLAGYPAWPAGQVHSVSHAFDALCRPLTSMERAQRSLDVRRDHGPHARRFMRVYANPIAGSAYAEARSFPVGSIIAKEKRASEDDPEPYAVAFMIKHAESERPDTDGWEFRFFPERPGASYQACADCHRSGATKDFVFTRLPLL